MFRRGQGSRLQLYDLKPGVSRQRDCRLHSRSGVDDACAEAPQVKRGTENADIRERMLGCSVSGEACTWALQLQERAQKAVSRGSKSQWEPSEEAVLREAMK